MSAKKTATLMAGVLTFSLAFAGTPVSAAADTETSQSEPEITVPANNTTDVKKPVVKKKVVLLNKKKQKRKIKSIKKNYKKYKLYMTKNQKKKVKKYLHKVKTAKKDKVVNKYYKKTTKIFKKKRKEAKHYSPWIKRVNGKRVQYSSYGPYEGENITATGRHIYSSNRYVAVPIQYIVSKSTWKKHKSVSWRKTHFYYHEKLIIVKHGRAYKMSVEDCGGFKGFGGYRYERLFDIAMTGGGGTGTVSKWRYCK